MQAFLKWLPSVTGNFRSTLLCEQHLGKQIIFQIGGVQVRGFWCNMGNISLKLRTDFNETE